MKKITLIIIFLFSININCQTHLSYYFKNSEKFETNTLFLIVMRIFMSSIKIYGAPKVIAPSNPIQIIVKKIVGILSRNLKMLIF